MTTEAASSILTIDLDAVADNWRRLRDAAAPAVCAAVVKADAYGLGIDKVAPALADVGCALFFVATLDEGLRLRALLPQVDVAVLGGLLPGTAPIFLRDRLIPVLNDLGQVERWRGECAKTGQAGAAILHIDTGMNRLGLDPREAERLALDATLLDGLDIRYVMTHMACADTPSDPLNEIQLARFKAALAALPGLKGSLAASSAIFLGRDCHFDLVRPGAALYGINPTPGKPNPMRQTVRLEGRVLQVRYVDSGEAVGYGASRRFDRPGKIATIATGYADGYLRSLSNGSLAHLAGHRVPMMGRVSMDLLTFDVTDLPEGLVIPGGLVELLGEQYTPDDAARDAGTIGYEILTSLGQRYARRYIGAGA
ncbi:alanine racemase [Oceanibaculum pacificum]|uniref:Alanine racemase n=2 Tax=Oceanibaculum pacificum TaxID=580166 RepID=A0A154VVR2_9PROT|nr:alanine racemase [Oceanibaculum pacificum]KZD05402.1 alanine racemase [Oceanibaculum pacificum]